MGTLCIQHGRIWDGQRFLSGDVWIENGIIAQVGGVCTAQADYVIDAAGCLVTPGLVDVHAHIRGLSPDFGTPVEASGFPFGVTAAAEAGASHGDAAMMDAFAVKTWAFVAAPVQDNQADFSGTEEALARYGRRAIGLKLFFDTSGGQVRDGQALRQVCGYARARGLKVMVHTTGTPIPMPEVLDCLAPGDICTHAYHGAPNTAAEDGFQALRAAKARGVVIDAGLAGGVHLDYQVAAAALKAGAAPSTVSTDITRLSAFKRGGRYGMTQCMSIMRTLGMEEEALLRSVTWDAAKALGCEDSCGLLAPGRAGDAAVLAYGGCPFDYTDNWGNRLQYDKGYLCLYTVADGEVVYRHRP